MKVDARLTAGQISMMPHGKYFWHPSVSPAPLVGARKEPMAAGARPASGTAVGPPARAQRWGAGGGRCLPASPGGSSERQLDYRAAAIALRIRILARAMSV